MTVARLDAVDAGLPRAISLFQRDRCFDENATRLSDRITVRLDGVELDEVTSYDVDLGKVVRRKRRQDGSFILSQGEPTYEELGGEVEVRWKAGAA